MNGSIFLKRYTNIIFLQVTVVAAVIILATVIRFCNSKLFSEIKTVYDEYMNTEISVSLVLGGE